MDTTKYYIGSPCREFGHTRRYLKSKACATCAVEKRRKFLAENQAEVNAKAALWRQANRALCCQRSKACRKADPVKKLAQNRKWRGLPEPVYPPTTRCENPGCITPLPYRTALHLDHCHKTGVFRGWLCGNCNTAYGKFGDSIEGLEQALEYLRRAYSAPPGEASKEARARAN